VENQKTYENYTVKVGKSLKKGEDGLVAGTQFFAHAEFLDLRPKITLGGGEIPTPCTTTSS